MLDYMKEHYMNTVEKKNCLRENNQFYRNKFTNINRTKNNCLILKSLEIICANLFIRSYC